MKKPNLKWLWKWFIPTDSKNEEPQIPTTISQEQGEDKLHIKDEMPEFLKQTLDEDSIQKWDYSVADADKTVCQKKDESRKSGNKRHKRNRVPIRYRQAIPFR